MYDNDMTFKMKRIWGNDCWDCVCKDPFLMVDYFFILKMKISHEKEKYIKNNKPNRIGGSCVCVLCA
jgi:hypothetical protein